VDQTFAITLAETGAASADAAWRWLRGSEYTPLAAELLSSSLARRLALGDARLLVRLGGNATFVSAAALAVASLGDTAVVSTDRWQALSRAEPDGAVVFRASTRPSRIAALWGRVQELAEQRGGFAHATLTRGVVRCVIPAPADASATQALGAALRALAADTTIVGERLPAALWTDIARVRTSDALAAGVRRAFDPDAILNPGILRIS
jgi:FAD/FMN-containing dehydrogenase